MQKRCSFGLGMFGGTRRGTVIFAGQNNPCRDRSEDGDDINNIMGPMHIV